MRLQVAAGDDNDMGASANDAHTEREHDVAHAHDEEAEDDTTRAQAAMASRAMAATAAWLAAKGAADGNTQAPSPAAAPRR